MTRFLTLFLCLAIGLASFGQAFGADTPPTVRLELESPTAAPGAKVAGTVVVAFGPGLHGYQNPPSESFMIPVTVSGADGTQVEGIRYPVGKKKAVGGATAPVAVYEGTVRIPVTVIAPATPGAATVTVNVRYQQCDEITCYPPKNVKATAQLTVAAATAPPSPPPIDPPVDNAQQDPTPGEEVRQAQVVRFAVQSTDPMVGTVLGWEVRDAERVQLVVPGVGRPVEVGLSGRYTVPAEASGEVVLRVTDGQGAVIQRTLTVAPLAPDTPVASEPTETMEPVAEAPLTTPEPDESAAPAPPKAEQKEGLDGLIQGGFQSGNFGLLIGLGLVAGLLLSLTPCVYPVIPITVTYFSNQASESRGARIGLGFMYALGIAITYGIVGGVFAALGGTVGDLFTQSWFQIGLFALLFGLSLTMFGVYEIGLPSFISKQLKGRSGPVGALIMGLLMGFAAAPCAGALVVAFTVGVAEAGNVPLGIGLFTSIGMGMGLPFMALAAVSTGANKVLPRSGGWLIVAKAALGLVVVTLALSYLFQGIGFGPSNLATPLIWAGVFVAMAVFFLVFHGKEATTQILGIKGTVVLVLGLLAGMSFANWQQGVFEAELKKLGVVSNEVQWEKYTPESFQAAVASGKPIFIKGTADWCVKCQEIEKAVFEDPEGIQLMRGVIALKVDHSTGVDQKYIDDTTEELGIKGLPHLMTFRPGGEPVETFFELKNAAELRKKLEAAGADL